MACKFNFCNFDVIYFTTTVNAENEDKAYTVTQSSIQINDKGAYGDPTYVNGMSVKPIVVVNSVPYFPVS
ncbi:hypothetical protein AGMMS49975_28430 [Clostridia bacterium]|nr:hypothetical protein AGMMS49975_28430 [Clostridia bacterium]